MKKLSLLCLLISGLAPLSAQELYTEFEDPSFERPPGYGGYWRGYEPVWRYTCYTNWMNTPDWFPDRRYGTNVTPKDGERFVGMVTRYRVDPGHDYEWSYESISSFRIELEAGEYFFWMYLAWNDSTYFNIVVQNFTDDYGHLPAKMRVVVGPAEYVNVRIDGWRYADRLSDGCGSEMKEVYLSPPITHNDWRAYPVTFKIEEPGFYIVRLESAMAPEIDTALIGGHVLVDDLSPIYREKMPKVEFPDTTLCLGDAMELAIDTTSMSDIQIEWDDGSHSPYRTVSEPGIYWGKATRFGLDFVDTFTVQVDTLPGFSLGEDTTLCEGDFLPYNFSFTPEKFSFNWNGRLLGDMAAIMEPGEYILEVFNEVCYGRDEIVVEYVGCTPTLRMPNVFTPNGDGLNDGFGPMEYENIMTYEIQVFDRWGRRLWVGDSPDVQWDGSYQGEPMAVGTYFWQCNYSNQRGELRNQKGSLTLLR